MRELAARAAALAGAPAPRADPDALPGCSGSAAWSTRSPASCGRPRYQFDRPLLLDSTAATDTLGVEPTPLDVSLAETVAALRR